MFEDFKKTMAKEFKMTDTGLMAYYLGIEVKQKEEGIFISQESYTEEILKKFKMDDRNPINTLVDCGIKLFKDDEAVKVDPTLFKSLVGWLRYLTCTRPDILYATRLMSRYMETLQSTLACFTQFRMITSSLDTVIVIGPEITRTERAQLVLCFSWETPPSPGCQRNN